jgi:hypothetical protein
MAREYCESYPYPVEQCIFYRFSLEMLKKATFEESFLGFLGILSQIQSKTPLNYEIQFLSN